MRFLFLIQGEGRGHLTQALSFAALLKKENHELVGVVVGKSPRRQVPDFFLQKIGTAVTSVESPNFETDGLEKKILLGKTIRKSLAKLPTYWTSLQKIHALIQDTQPEVVVNFYEPLAGLYNLLFAPKIAFWAIGHQYLESHPEFTFAPKRGLEKFLFQLHTRFTAWGCIGAFGTILSAEGKSQWSSGSPSLASPRGKGIDCFSRRLLPNLHGESRLCRGGADFCKKQSRGLHQSILGYEGSSSM